LNKKTDFRTLSPPSSRGHALYSGMNRLLREDQSRQAVQLYMPTCRYDQGSRHRTGHYWYTYTTPPEPEARRYQKSNSPPTSSNHQNHHHYHHPKRQRRHPARTKTKTMPSADWEQHFLDKFLASSSRASSPSPTSPTPRNSSPARWSTSTIPRQNNDDVQIPRSASSLSPAGSHRASVITSTATAAAAH
jgi:hypothetical protein